MRNLIITAALAITATTACAPTVGEPAQQRVEAEYFYGAEDAAQYAADMTDKGAPTCVAPTDDGRWAAYRC